MGYSPFYVLLGRTPVKREEEYMREMRQLQKLMS
jgi:hypothetical protein